MAPRRGTKTKVVVNNGRNYKDLCLADALCPICRTVWTQPVTLPCNHGFCYTCFEGTMQNANLACPLCRVRIGSWYRIAKKENRLVNEPLWKVVQERFSQQLENKRNGIDEDDSTNDLNVSISTPGEIRKEYEEQRKKELEQIIKETEAEEKASEPLISKYKKEELEYEQALQEKLKTLEQDEQIAKKLAQQWSSSPNPSKSNKNKKGPLDSFLKSQTPKKYNFSTKEYTCRVLCLDKEVDVGVPSTSKGSTAVPLIQKKIQQLQKIAANDSSDGSDCIEQECRYFKPIDYKHNPPTARKTPIKIPGKKAASRKSTPILSPSGTMNFQSNILESAFARISMPVLEDRPSLKRKITEAKAHKPKRLNAQENEFYGFEREESPPKLKSRKRSSDAKLVQEKADYEFALKLQKELNQTAQYSTRSHVSSSRRPRRQITLDEIVANTAYKVK